MKTLSIALALAVLLQGAALAAPPGQKTFESLDDAVNALVGAFRAGDRKALIEILGPKGRPLISSGDEVADRAAFQRFVTAYDRAHRLEGGGGKVVLSDGPRWFWDTDAGDDELLYRRIGRNELSAIEVCLAYLDAQREYYSRDRGAGILEYAQRLESTKGKRDGLYWETKPGERPSPLGPLVADARAAGYTKPEPGKRMPYHGYLYRLLLAQGPEAPGGAYDYLVKGHMIGGFALVAYPATYAVSGITTFIVSHDGVVYEKDLGPRTAQIANAMKMFNPDKTWTKIASDASPR